MQDRGRNRLRAKSRYGNQRTNRDRPRRRMFATVAEAETWSGQRPLEFAPSSPITVRSSGIGGNGTISVLLPARSIGMRSDFIAARNGDSDTLLIAGAEESD